MYCPRCDARIPAEDTHLGTLVARCRRCNEVFRFADQLDPPTEGHPVERRAARPDCALVEDNRDARRLSFAWTVNSSPNVPYVETRPYALAMFRCSLAIDIFLALAFGLVIGDLYYTTASREQIIANHKKMGIDVTPLFTSSPPPYGFYLAGMVTCTTGMFLLTHIAVAKLLNRTTIVLDASRLTVRHGPLP
jgi:hypothetical protein